MDDYKERTKRVLSEEQLNILSGSRVAVFGVGGVGGHVCEALARAGVGQLDLIDKDVVDVTNINRQIIALRSTIGRNKVDVMKDRIFDIDPDCIVRTYPVMYLPDTADRFDFAEYDYIVDAVDNVTAKIDLVVRAGEAGVPIISSMGTGNKIHPEMLELADIYKTSVCPLARVMRRELRARNIKSLQVVYSREEPVKNEIVGSVSWVPGAAGLLIAGAVIRNLCEFL